MKRAVLAVTLLVMAGVASPASANYHYSKPGAQRLAKDFVGKRYSGVNRFEVSAFCRPQGAAAADSRFKYHRWVCGWAQGGVCGVVRIVGSSSAPGAYYGKVLRGAQGCRG